MAVDQVAQLVGALPHTLDRPDRVAGAGEERLAGVGETYVAGTPDEQVVAELALELGQLGADARLADVEALRRGRERAVVDDGDEVAELSDFHHL